MTATEPKLHILYLITKSNYGGAQKYIFELATAAKAAGHTVSVACGGTGEAGAALGELATKLQEADIPIHSIDRFQRNMSLLDDLLAFFSVWRIVRRRRPDVLHATSSKAGGIGALAGRLCRIRRVIFTSHGLTMDEQWRPRWQRLLITLGTWCTLRLAHHSIMISSETYERTRQMPGLQDRVTLIPNGIAPINFHGRKHARNALAPDIPTRAIWIGGIGELHPNKNWAAAIEAMATLPKHTHLLIIGEGEERPKLEQQIVQHGLQDRVHLLGYLHGAPHLCAFDIFILPSLKEGLPYVLLEAGLAALPVVASDLPGNRDIIETGQTGLLVEPTATQFSTALAILLRDERMRQTYGTALQQTTQDRFSIERMVAQTFKLYQVSSSRA